MTTKVSNRVLANDAVQEPQIAAGAVNYTDIAAGALRTVHYGSLSIPAGAYQLNSIPSTAYADRSVISVKIGLAQILAEHYAALSIPTGAYQNLSLTTAKYAERSVTHTKIGLKEVYNENLADASVDGRTVATGALAASHFANNTIAPIRLANGTAGDILVAGTGGVFAYLPKGTEDSVLGIKNGAPVWTSSFSTGMHVDYLGSTAPTGWIMANGRTIGNAASGALERANADCYNLFVLLWSVFPTVLTVSGGRGGTADADWAANKTIALPDMRGRTTVGHDAMGNSDAGRLTAATAAPNGTTLGASGGTESVSLTENQIPPHSHNIMEFVGSNPEGPDSFSPTNTVLSRGGGGNISYSTRAGNGTANVGKSSTYGAGQAFSNMAPFFVTNKIIKL